MVKRTITITGVFIILAMAISFIILLDRASLATTDDVVITFDANGDWT